MDFGKRTLSRGTEFRRKRVGVAKEGDVVILSAAQGNYDIVRLEKNCIFNNKYGHFHHNNMIGKSFGSWIQSTAVNPNSHKKTKLKKSGKVTLGELCMIRPTCEVWSNTLLHRTQILYHADISLVLFGLDIKPGYNIYESGTGSGSLSSNIARAVANSYDNSKNGQFGHLFTFEFNAPRVVAARRDFEILNISNVVSVFERNIVKNGFPNKSQLVGMIEDILDSSQADTAGIAGIADTPAVSQSDSQPDSKVTQQDNDVQMSEKKDDMEVEEVDQVEKNGNKKEKLNSNRNNFIKVDADKNGFSSNKLNNLGEMASNLKKVENELFIDGVFLDLPKPEDAIESAFAVLGYDRNICSFSPCIEQVQQTCEKLRSVGFIDIRTFEVLSRDYVVRPQTYDIIDYETNYWDLVARKRQMRIGDIGDNTEQKDAKDAKDQKNEKNGKKMSEVDESERSSLSYEYIKYARQKEMLLKEGLSLETITKVLGSEPEKYDVGAMKVRQSNDKLLDGLKYTSGSLKLNETDRMYQTLTARPIAVTFGHTGYLTFAKKPLAPREQQNPQCKQNEQSHQSQQSQQSQKSTNKDETLIVD